MLKWSLPDKAQVFGACDAPLNAVAKIGALDQFSKLTLRGVSVKMKSIEKQHTRRNNIMREQILSRRLLALTLAMFMLLGVCLPGGVFADALVLSGPDAAGVDSAETLAALPGNTLTLGAANDTYIHGSNNAEMGKPHGTESNVVMGQGITQNEDGDVIGVKSRVPFYQFDLSEVQGTIRSAKLTLTTHNNGPARTAYYAYIDETAEENPLNNWSEDTLSWNDYLSAKTKDLWNYQILGTVSVPGGNPGAGLTMDVTSGAQMLQTTDHKKLTILLYDSTESNQNAKNLCTKECQDHNGAPVLSLVYDTGNTDLDTLSDAGVELNRRMQGYDQDASTWNRIDVTDSINLPTDLNGVTVEWASSNEDVITSDGTVIRPGFMDGDRLLTLTAQLICGEEKQKLVYQVKVPRKDATEDDYLALAADQLKGNFHNTTQLTAFELPTTFEGGVTAQYASSNESALAVDNTTGLVTVNRPPADQPTAVVKVTATLLIGGSSKEFNFTIYVSKITSDVSTSMRGDLGAILEKAKALQQTGYHVPEDKIKVYADDLTDGDNQPDGVVVGDAWGQFPPEAAVEFSAVVQSAQEIYDNPSAGYAELYTAANDLISEGKAYILKANLSDDAESPLVKNVQDYKLRFSEYRRTLLSLVYEAETSLLLEPYYYPRSAQEVLQNSIDTAKEVLDYTYQKCFVRGRHYLPRPDEQIQHEINRYNMRETEADYKNNEGLEVNIGWYRTQHILLDAYSSVMIPATADTYLKSDSPKDSYGSAASIIIGKSRVAAMLKFDLAPVQDTLIISARGGMYHYHGGGAAGDIYWLDDPSLQDWDESTMSYSLYDSTKTKPMNENFSAGTFTTGNNPNPPAKVEADMTTAVRKKLSAARGTQFTMLYVANTPNNASDCYTKEGSSQYAPYLEVKTNQVPIEKLHEKYDFVMDRMNQLLKKASGNIGSNVGNYRQEDYDTLMYAKSEADAALERGDQAEAGMALVNVYNAMRDMSDNQLMRNLVEPESNLYFTNQDKMDLIKKMETMPELKQYYLSKTANVNNKTLDQYEEGYNLYMSRNDGLNQSAVWYDAISAFNGPSYETWSGGRRAINAKTPEGAAYVSYQITLPSINNEEDAAAKIAEESKYGGKEATPRWLGHVWIDNTSITDGNGQQLLQNIKSETNRNFEKWNGEMPANWEFVGSGSPKLYRETSQYKKKEGTASLLMQNNTAADEAALRYHDQNNVSDEVKAAHPGVENYMFPIRVTEETVDGQVIKTPVPVESGYSLTVNVDVKQDGYLHGFNNLSPTDGLRVKVQFYDIDGNEITASGGTWENWYNYRIGGNQRPDVGDALAYMVTGNKEYAEKVKYSLITAFADFCSSSEINESTNMEANARGEVQAGRFLAIHMSMYAMIEDADVFTDEEYDLFLDLVDEIVGYCNSRRDQSIYPDHQYMNSNWYSDMFLGSSVAAMALREEDPDNPGKLKPSLFHAKELIDSAEWQMFNMLEDSIAESGAYAESLRYMWASYSRVASCSRAYRNTMNHNWFEMTKLPLVFEYGVQTQTTAYRYIGNRISSPPFGDTTIKEGAEGMAMLGQYASDVGAVNPTLGAQMMQTWKDAGSPVGCDAEGVVLSAFFVPLDTENHGNIPVNLTSTDYYHEMSPILMRNNYGMEDETLCIPISSVRDLNHGHEDQGSFTLYKPGSFLVVDTSVENYWDTGSKYRYLSSSTHACFTFYKDGETPKYENNVSNRYTQTADVTSSAVGMGTSKLRESSYNDRVDKVKIEIPALAGGGTNYRNLAMIKPLDTIVIWDQVEDNNSYTQFNLPVASFKTEIDQAARKAVQTGYYDYNVETTFLEPENIHLAYDQMQMANVVPTREGEKYPYIEVLRGISKEKGQSHLTVVKPVKKGEAGITTSKLPTGNANVTGYQISDTKGNSAVVLVNIGMRGSSVTLNQKGLVNLETGEAFNGSVPAGTMLILSAQPDSVPEQVRISGTGVVQKPTNNGTIVYNYQADLLDQYGIKMTGLNKNLDLAYYQLPSNQDYVDQYIKDTARPDDIGMDIAFNSTHPELVGYPKITWSIAGNPEGVAIDPEKGILTVDSNIKTDQFQIVASSNGVSETMDVRVGSAAQSYPNSIRLEGPGILGLEKGKTFSAQYIPHVYDQFGAEISNASGLTWSLTSQMEGISIKDGLLTIPASIVDQILGADNSGRISFTVVVKSLSNVMVKEYMGVTAELERPTVIVTSLDAPVQIGAADEEFPLTAAVTTQNGTEIDWSKIKSVNWKLSQQAQELGFALDGGTLFIPASAIGEDLTNAVVTVDVLLSDGITLSKSIPIQLTRNQIAASLEITGRGSITAQSQPLNETYTAAVKDRFGNSMDQTVTWRAAKLVDGTSFNVNNGVLSVAASAKDGQVVLTATSDGGLTASKTIEIQSRPGDSGGGKGDGSKGHGGSGGAGGSGTAVSGGGTGPEPVPVTPTETPKFADVPDSHWGYPYIQSLGTDGKLSGSGDGNFYPENNVTRAEFVQMLVNILGNEGGSSEPEFSDVTPDDWYYTAVSAAAAKGYIEGYDGLFYPDDPITRQDMSVIMKRILDDAGIVLPEGPTQKFSDQGDIADYAADPVAAMQRGGFLNGYEDGSFRPANHATRAEAAKLMAKMDGLLK